MYAYTVHASAQSPSYAPYIVDVGKSQRFAPFLLAVDNTYGMVCRVFLGKECGNLGQCLCGRYAQRSRDARIAPYPGYNAAAEALQGIGPAEVEIQKGLVD